MTASALTIAAQTLRDARLDTRHWPWIAQCEAGSATVLAPGDAQEWGLPTVAECADDGDARWIALMDPSIAEPLAELLDAIEAHWPSHVVARTGTVITGRILRAARSIAVVINGSAS